LIVPLASLLLAIASETPTTSATSLQIWAGFAATTLDDDLVVGLPLGVEVLHRRDRLWLGGGGGWQSADNAGASDVRPLELESSRLQLGAGWSLLRWRALDVRMDLDAAGIRTTTRRSAWSGMISGVEYPATTSTRYDATVGLDVAVRLAQTTGGPALELVPLACETGSLVSCSAHLAAGWVF